MLKILGMLFLCSSVCCFGIVLGEKQKTCAKLTEEILDLTNHITRNIKYEKKALNYVYSHYSSPLLEKTGFLEDLRQRNDIRTSVNQNLYTLTDELRENVISFFENLGKSAHSKNELEKCLLYLEIFHEQNEKASREAKAKSLLYKKLGIIFALLLAIILI